MARLFDDASSQYLEIDSTPIDGEPLTISAWINSDDLTSADDQAIVFIGDKDVSNGHFMLRFDPTDPSEPLIVRKRSGAADGTAQAGTLVADTWYHCAGVFASTTSRTAYVDGIFAIEDTTSVGNNTEDRISIGRAGDSTPGDYFSGRIAEVAIWNAALTAAEVAALAAGAGPLMVRPQSLVFYLPLVRDNDVDLVGGLSMTAFNTPTIGDHPPKMFYPAPPFAGYLAIESTRNFGISAGATAYYIFNKNTLKVLEVGVKGQNGFPSEVQIVQGVNSQNETFVADEEGSMDLRASSDYDMQITGDGKIMPLARIQIEWIKD
jgi:hypothetical protein